MINLNKIASTYLHNVDNCHFRIFQIGCGGTGSNLVQHIAQIISLAGNKHIEYTIVDPDILEMKNLKNQLFLEDEVGEKKADILAERYSEAFDIPINSYSEKYIEKIEEFEKLMEYTINTSPYSHRTLNILIGAVDNNATRKLMHSIFYKYPNILYIDAGNDSAIVPNDWTTRSINQWTQEEIEEYENSGWNGQVCSGLRIGDKTYLIPVAEQFHGILDDEDTLFPSQVSCSELSASEPQRIFVNKMSAFIVSNILNEIISSFTLTNHYSIFNAQKCFIRSCEANITNDL